MSYELGTAISTDMYVCMYAHFYIVVCCRIYIGYFIIFVLKFK